MGSFLSKSPPEIPPPRHRSLRSNDPALLRFHNTTSRDVRIYWLDYKGVRREYAMLEPGASRMQPTFCTHGWTFESLGRLRLRHLRGTVEFLYVPLFDQTTREAVVYPAELTRTVTIVEAPPVAWGPDTHAENYREEWKRAVRAVVMSHARQRKAREVGLLDASVTTLGDLPLDVLYRILGVAAPSVTRRERKPAVPEGAGPQDYTQAELEELFRAS